MRGRYEGMWNVVRFNWPMYIVGLGGVTVASVGACSVSELRGPFAVVALIGAILVLVPLVVSHVIYDRSDLYDMPWLQGAHRYIVNVTAGFDESSAILHRRFPQSALQVIDLFDAERCTEPSIARARKAYPPYPDTTVMTGGVLPYGTSSVDLVVAFLSLHEVRAHAERVKLLKEMHRSLTADGRIVITEHLRDLPNALAFSVGVGHFLSHRTWAAAFHEAELRIITEERTAGFITTYLLARA